MRLKKVKLIAVLLMGLGYPALHAQEAISPTGGNVLGSGGSMCYTVGQSFYTINSGTNGSVAHGVQQPFEISVVSGIEEGEGINLTYSAYPNPTTDFLTLKVDATAPFDYAQGKPFSIQSISYQLYDVSGKIVENKKIVDNETLIVMSNLVSAIYFLKVIHGDKEYKTFKIIKK